MLITSVMVETLFFSSAFADSGVFNFKQLVTGDDGKKYVIGEIQNSDPDNNIESVIYFGNSIVQSISSQNVGVIGHGMAMPFKIELPYDQTSISELNVQSHVTFKEPDDFLEVNYSTLRMDNHSHAISGILQNKSPLEISNVKVYAIAMSAHAKVLDVTSSNPILQMLPNDTARFTLRPISSISHQVGYYSCFVAGQSGQNYTLAAEDGQNISFELGSDGEIKNVRYDNSTHSISFNIEGVFPQGGWAELMMVSQPKSYDKAQSLGAILNGQNATKSISSIEILSGKEYKHISLLFPFGKNTVSIQPYNPIPEFPFATIILIIAILPIVMISRIKHSCLKT